MTQECIFCKLIRKEIPTEIIYEDENTFAFLDIRPASPKGGHILVIPKNHYALITEIPEKELNALISTVKKITNALLKRAPGVNVLQNNGSIAGQFIFHSHFHLIPRYEKDGIIIEKWAPNSYKEGEMKKVADEIRSLI